jgi:hypothetical protein
VGDATNWCHDIAVCHDGKRRALGRHSRFARLPPDNSWALTRFAPAPKLSPIVNEPTRTCIRLGVALVHFVSGEDVIARVEYDAESKVYSLTRPVTPVMQPKMGPNGKPVGATIALVPYRPFIDDSEPVLIRDANVLFTAKVLEQLEKVYTQTTSDIVVAHPCSIGNLEP